MHSPLPFDITSSLLASMRNNTLLLWLRRLRAVVVTVLSIFMYQRDAHWGEVATTLSKGIRNATSTGKATQCLSFYSLLKIFCFPLLPYN